jgi:ketosteroid isomerase-like protein
MKTLIKILVGLLIIVSCKPSINKEEVKLEIYNTEKAFEKMCTEKSVADAFYFYADSNATINRGNDSLIKGKEAIKIYYQKRQNNNATVNWTPDFIEVSECGTLGYTYGKYTWKVKNKDNDSIKEYIGIFHTVWKKQKDNTWKYVWD